MSFFLPICRICQNYFTDENNNEITPRSETRSSICLNCAEKAVIMRKLKGYNVENEFSQVYTKPEQTPYCGGETFRFSDFYTDIHYNEADLEVDVDQIRIDLSNEFALCNEEILEANQFLEDANQCQKDLRARRMSFQNRLNQIRSQFERMIHLIRERQSETVQELQEARNEQEEALSQRQMNLKKRLAKLQVRKHSLKELMALSNEDLVNKKNALAQMSFWWEI